MTSSAVENSALATSLQVTDDALVVELTDGRTISVPISWFPRLLKASPDSRANYEILGEGEGIHWPDADEDISVAGLLAGRADTSAANRT